MRTKIGFILLAVLLTLTGTATADEQPFDAQAAFDRLAEMQGTWTGTAKGEGDEVEAEGTAGQEFEVTHTFQLSANGSVVMETMNPGTPHEMINMYHLDGADLMLTHYCAGGNQPRMRVVADESTADHFVFDFDGGTNLDPSVDPHIHAARLQFLEGGSVDSIWLSQAGGEDAGKMAFHLTRAE